MDKRERERNKQTDKEIEMYGQIQDLQSNKKSTTIYPNLSRVVLKNSNFPVSKMYFYISSKFVL